MKKMTCRDLGGPCDAELTGNSFIEIGKKSHDHVLEQIRRGDPLHIQSANEMKDASPEKQQERMAEYQKRFIEALEV